MQTNYYMSNENLTFVLQTYSNIIDYSFEQIDNQINLFEQIFELPKESSVEILKHYPKAFFLDEADLKLKCLMIKESLNLEKGSTLSKMIVKNPFLLKIEYDHFIEYFITLRKYGFKTSELSQIVYEYPLFLFGKSGKF